MELYFPFILDGATGTELQKRGYTGEICAEKWVLEHPEAINDLHSKYVAAGSNIVYAPTFSANSIKLAENGIIGQTAEYNKKLVEVARAGVSEDTLIAGDMSPTGKFLAPLGDMSFEELVDIYTEQAQALEEAGVDIFALETMMTVSDARAAVLACKSVSSKPVFVTFSSDKNGKAVSGADVAAICVIMQGMGVNAYGLNCSSGPEDMLVQIKRIAEYAEIPLIAKPNAGLPEVVNGKTVYNCPPEEFVSCTAAFAAAGVGMMGGCCGSTPEHIAALAQAAKGVTPVRPKPAHPGLLPLCTEKKIFLLPPDVPISAALKCDENLADAFDAFEGADDTVIAVVIDTEEALTAFEQNQYAVSHPLCIRTENAELLEKALRVFQGRAMYDGNLSDTVLEQLSRKYGLIY